MPTSSQALILKSTNGNALPPILNRRQTFPREWLLESFSLNTRPFRPTVATTHEGFKPQEYVRNTQRPRAGTRLQALPLRRTGSAPNLHWKMDYASLPQFLQVRGLHASSIDRAVSWKVNAIGPFYDRNLARQQRVSFQEVEQISHEAEDVYESPRYGSTDTLSPRYDNMGVYHGPLMRSPTWNNKPIMKTKIKFASGGEYFKLIQSGKDDKTGQPTFKLQKSHPSEVGSFRLSPTQTNDVGDFKLVPPPGFVSNDFRIVQSNDVEGEYVILQASPNVPGAFTPLERNATDSPEFRMVMAKVREHIDKETAMQNAWMEKESGNEFERVKPRDIFEYRMTPQERHGHMLKHKTPSLEGRWNENRYLYDYYDDVADEVYIPTENNWTYAERSRNGSNMYNKDTQNTIQAVMEAQKEGSAVQRSKKNQAVGSEKKGNTEEFIDEIPNDDENKRDDDLQTRTEYDDKLLDKLVHLGFRKPKSFQQFKTEREANLNKKDVLPGIINTAEWKQEDFDQWSRTTVVTDKQKIQKLLGKSEKEEPENNQIEKKPTPDDDEEKLRADYKQLKKKKIASVRLRKELPPSDPHAVVIRLHDNTMTHVQVKDLVENETGSKIIGIRFDPVLANTSDKEAKSQWILRFEKRTTCETLVISGIRICGFKCFIRHFDDVMREEHEAYKFLQLVKQMNDRKLLKSAKSKTSQTQTLMPLIKT